MKNKLSDLNNYLFEQIEKLNDDSIKGEDMQLQIEKSKTVCNIAKMILDTANTQLNGLQYLNDIVYDKSATKAVIKGILDYDEV